MNIPAMWRELALDPPRASGPALGTGRLRSVPEDFVVDEDLGFEPRGEGSHVLVQVRKRGANTDWVARELARDARVRHFDVGYAGLKDRHAVTTQWFSVPRGRREPATWVGQHGEGYEVLAAHAHHRKLPRGALAANRFELRIRDVTAPAESLAERMAAMAAHGVPNYFGPQRFGRGLGNLAALSRGALDRRDRHALSAARSLVFNALLAERVRRGDWARLLPGDLANLDGTGSIFAVEALDDALLARVARLDVHPTGPLPGRGDSRLAGAPAALEASIAAQFADVVTQLATAGLEAARRPLRVAVRDLRWDREADALRLRFRLDAGSFATTVVREILDVHEAEQGADDAGDQR